MDYKSNINEIKNQSAAGNVISLSKASENVGIGTDSPGAKLDVQGTILVNNEIQFVDANMRIFRSSNDMRIRTGGSDKVTILSGGNVGIGTTGPQRLLQLRSTNEATGIFLERTSNYGFVQYNQQVGSVETYHLGFVNNNTFSSDILVANESGNVGIGIDDPAARLEVKSSLYVSHPNAEEITFRLDNYGATGTDAGPLLRMFNQSGTTVVNIDSRSGSSRDTYFNQGGNVGIGVTSPITKLNVGGNIAVTATKAYRMYNAANNAWGEMSFIEADNRIQFNRGIQNSGVDWRLSENSADSYVCALQGNFGIGTTSPDSKLEVDMADASGNRVGFIGDGSTTGSALWTNWTTGASYLDFRLGGVTSAYNKMRITSGGNVGIGPSVTNPIHKLEVRDGTISGEIAKFSAINPLVVIEASSAGNAALFLKPNATGSKRGEFRVTNADDYGFIWTADTSVSGTAYMELEASSTGGGDLTVKGDVIAYGAPSDKKYKENIRPIESALDKAMQLQGVTFDWKDNDSILDIKEDIGFIAQDVREVLPELVRDNGKGNLSLRYQGITPILLEAIKELKAEIEELKKQIK
jgi:hypothetical protein